MRRQTIIKGFKNSQKFRFILTAHSGEHFGMTLTIQQMSDQFATTEARNAVWTALERLAQDRSILTTMVPVGLVINVPGFRQVQIDLH